MRKKRSILCCLLCMLLSLFGVFSSYAYSVASGSDADYYMQNAQEFVPKFVPMSSDPASNSNDNPSKLLKSSGTVLRSSLPTVSNTVDLSYPTVNIGFSNGEFRATRMLPDGHLKYTDSKGRKISSVHFDFPRASFPNTGTYLMSMSIRSVASGNILSAYCGVWQNTQSMVANSYAGTVIPNNSFQKSLGDLYLSPTKLTMENFKDPHIVVNYETTSSTIDCYVALRFAYSNNDTSGAVKVGAEYNDSDSVLTTAQNTSQLVYSQNETNGLLHDIIQHISDQLAAMWDQIYNLMAVPWIQNDNQRTNNTISAIEESSQNTQTTIEEQTQWHGNFIIEGLKGLFIPSDDYFEGITSDLFDWFDDKFGFLGYTLTYFIRLLNGIMGASQNTVIHFPGIKVPNRATNEVYNILPAQDVDLGAQIGLISEGSFSLLEFMRTAGDIVLVLGFVVMLQNKLHEVESK